MSERHFDESEIGPILQRASELQAGAVSGGASGFTLTDIQRLASEVGIDPAMVARAAGELSAQPQDAVVDERASSILLDQTVDGVLDEEGWEEVVTGLRHYAKRSGATRQRGSTSEWSCRSDAGGVTFSATRRGDSTRLRLIGDMSTGLQAIWSTAGPICFVLAVVSGALLSKHTLEHVWAFVFSVVALATGCVAIHFGTRAWARRARADLRGVFERATRAVRQGGDVAPLTVPNETETEIVQRVR